MSSNESEEAPLSEAERLHRERFEQRNRAYQAEEKRSGRIGNLRLALAIVALVLLVLPLFVRHGGPWWALFGMLFVFLFLGRWHDRVETRSRRFANGATFHRRELDRIEEKWRDLSDDGKDLNPVTSLDHEDMSDQRQVELAHLAGDLDLFGPASLFQLLSRAVTPAGRSSLARWLVHGAERSEVVARQAAVVELAGDLDFREAIFVAASGDGRSSLDPSPLLKWAEHPRPMPVRGLLRVLSFVQPMVLIGSLAWVSLGGPPQVLAVVALVHIGTLMATRRAVAERLAVLFTPDRALLRYAALIEAVESKEFESPRLTEVRRALETEGVSASERIRQLRRISERLEWNMNVFFSLSIGPVLMWDLHHVLQSERWQQVAGARLRAWFAALGELEALASFAALRFLRPDYAMPQLLEEEGVVAFSGITHPLLDHRRAKSNDLELGGPGSVLLLSGSNMSGKSTLLRSVGVNILLAQAGAPVAASSMRVSPIVLMTSIRVVDSLARGTSHFYAELQRIKEALDKAKQHGARLLYLLDEMLHGTNSKERYVGAVSVIKWMSEQRAMGIVTTHDLSVAKVADVLPKGVVTNRHFGDTVVGNEIRFDYDLKEGPVQTTNALRLMKAIGIDIELEAPRLDE